MDRAETVTIFNDDNQAVDFNSDDRATVSTDCQNFTSQR
jgi:hypothetical protein